MVYLYFHYIHDTTCQKADWVNSQVDGQTLLLLVLQLPYESKKRKWLDLQLTLEGTLDPVNILGYEDSLKGLKWGFRDIFNDRRDVQLSWKAFHCFPGENETPEPRRILLTLKPFRYSTPFSLPRSHGMSSVPRKLYVLAHVSPLACPGLSVPKPFPSIFAWPTLPHASELSSLPVSSPPPKLRFPLSYLQVLCPFPS